MRLTDTQLVLLSAASQREDRAIELPANLKGGAARKVIAKLLDEKLVEELPARGSLPAWRRDEAEGAFALCITRNGLKAIQVDGEAGEIEGDSAAQSKPRSQRAEPRRPAKPGRNRKSRASACRKASRTPRSDSKQATVVAMLSRAKGTTISAIVDATGWQQHSVRGFFAGVVRKKLKLNLVSEKKGDDRIYRIVTA